LPDARQPDKKLWKISPFELAGILLLHGATLRKPPMAASTSSVTFLPPSAAIPAPAKTAKPEHRGFGFADFLDVVNPLQHVPIVSTIYRRLTGDTMSGAAEVAGGALFGGLVGALASLADVIFTEKTGKDFGETVAGWIGLGDKRTELAKAGARAPVHPVVSAVPVKPSLPGEAVPGLPALMKALKKQGVDPAIAARAALAYQNAIENKKHLVSLPPAL